MKPIKFSHINKNNDIAMVDVTDKKDTLRIAKATATVKLDKNTLTKIITNKIIKGDVLTTAKIAGILAAKNTSSLIPLCHNLNLSHIDIEFHIDKKNSCIIINSSVSLNGKTGAEMEALIAVNIAALTIYDMCKALNKRIKIDNIHLVYKSGGKSGTFFFNKK